MQAIRILAYLIIIEVCAIHIHHWEADVGSYDFFGLIVSAVSSNAING